MLYSKVLLFASILLATNVLADDSADAANTVNIIYSATYYSNLGSSKDGKTSTSTSAGTVPADKEDDVIANLHTWSNGACAATKGPRGIKAKSAGTFASSAKAQEANQNCRGFVGKHT